MGEPLNRSFAVDWFCQEMRWPIIRRLLESDHDLSSVAKALGRRKAWVERVLTSNRTTIRPLAEVAHALNCRLDFKLRENPIARVPPERPWWPSGVWRPTTSTARAPLEIAIARAASEQQPRAPKAAGDEALEEPKTAQEGKEE